MNPVVPALGGRSWGVLRDPGFQITRFPDSEFCRSERYRRCTRLRRSRRRYEDWSGKTRIRLHGTRRKQYNQRDHCNGRDSSYETNP
jgi:hypothetical protein